MPTKREFTVIGGFMDADDEVWAQHVEAPNEEEATAEAVDVTAAENGETSEGYKVIAVVPGHVKVWCPGD